MRTSKVNLDGMSSSPASSMMTQKANSDTGKQFDSEKQRFGNAAFKVAEAASAAASNIWVFDNRCPSMYRSYRFARTHSLQSLLFVTKIDQFSIVCSPGNFSIYSFIIIRWIFIYLLFLPPLFISRSLTSSLPSCRESSARVCTVCAFGICRERACSIRIHIWKCYVI